MEKILVIGGAGYVGGITTDLLVKQGYQVTVYDNLLYEERYMKNVSFIYGDIRDTSRLLKAQKNYDIIIWLAAIVGDGACSQDPELTYEINYNSLKRFLDKTKRIILYPSTCSIYGAQNEILNEKSKTNPLSVYAKTKLLAELLTLEYGGMAFRLGTLFGIGDEFSRIRLDLVINILTYKSIVDKKITVFGGEQWRPVLSVTDVAKYFVEAVTKDYNDVFVISLKNIKIIELVDIYKNIFDDLDVDIVDISFEDSRNYRVCSEKADNNFSHRPSISIETEILRMKEILSSRRIKNPDNDIYYNTHHVRQMLDSIRKY